MTSKVMEGHKSSTNFRVNPTLPLSDGLLMLPTPNCVDLSISFSLYPSLMQKFIYTQLVLDEVYPYNNLDLCSYGQLLSMFLRILYITEFDLKREWQG
jgi:hypothetical protein